MSAAQLSEKTRNLILNQIKANIAAELKAIRTDRGDSKATLEAPKHYFIFDDPIVLQTPAIIVYVDSGETIDKEKGQNFVNARLKVMVAVVLEGQEAGNLTIACERYQAALFQILHWKDLVDTTNNVKLWVRVARFKFSPTFERERKNEGLASFRKEVSLELDCEHYENPTS